MPKCYLLAVCDGSALDRDRNSFSLFNLIEELKMAPPPDVEDLSGLGLPFEIHVYWELDEEELGVPFQFRLIHTVDGQETVGERDFDLVSELPRQRVRIQGLPVPALGLGHLGVEWKRVADDGEDWEREDIRWPLNVLVRESNGEGGNDEG